MHLFSKIKHLQVLRLHFFSALVRTYPHNWSFPGNVFHIKELLNTLMGSLFSPSPRIDAGGKWWLVEPMAKAAVAAGADGLMIEVHNNPEAALCDGAQSLKPEKYDVLLQQVRQIAEVVGKKF